MLKLGTVMHIGHPNVITLTFRRCDGGVTGYLADNHWRTSYKPILKPANFPCPVLDLQLMGDH